MNLLQASLEKGDLGGAVAVLEAQRPAPGQKDLRGWEWRYFWQRCQSDQRFRFCQYADAITALAFSPDGRWLALRRERGAVALWDTLARKPVAELASRGARKALALSPQGNLLAFGDVETNGKPVVTVWNVATHQEMRLVPPTAAAHLAFSPDGTLLATLALDGIVTLWHIPSGQAKTNLQVSKPTSGFSGRILFSPDGRLLAIGEANAIRLWEWASGRQRAISVCKPGDDIWAMAISSDGRLLAVGSALTDSQIQVWDLTNLWNISAAGQPQLVGRLMGHRNWISDLAFAPDGKTLASASGDQTVRLWDINRMGELRQYQGHRHEVWAVGFTPEGKDLVSGGRDGSVRYWNPVEKPQEPPPIVLPVPIWSGGFAFAPDGRRFIALDNRDGSASLWETATSRPLKPLSFLGTNNTAIKWSPDGRILAVADRIGNLRIWDYTNRLVITNFALEGTPFAALRFCGRGHSLWYGTTSRTPGGDRMVKAWNVADWRELPLPADALQDVQWMTISPDNRIFASLTGDGTVGWYDLASGERLRQFKHHFASAGGTVVFSPDGRTLVGSASDGLTTLWDVATAHVLATVRGNVGSVNGIAYSPDGRRLLTSGKDPTDVVRLMDPGSRRYVAKLSGPPDYYQFVDMSSDGNTLVAVGGAQRTALLWRAPSWAEIEAAEKGQVTP